MDKEFIDDPDRWPNWPMLPVKRRDNSLANKNLGLLIDQGKKTRTVFHVYMFDLPDSFEDAPKTEYANTDAMVADGWRVD